MNDKKKLSDLNLSKQKSKKFAVLACYDYITAKLANESGIEVLLVGDSANQHLLGQENTLSATMDFMVEITAAVRRAAPLSFLIADMPFLSYQCGISDAVKNAARFIIESKADIVKIETAHPYLPVIKAVSDAGIPVMAHIGIRPQTNVFTVQGRDAQKAMELVTLAEMCIEAGARALLLEGTASEVAKNITESSQVPVIGCGSGPDCDGNVLIAPDVLGLTIGKMPKFSKKFGDVKTSILNALTDYRQSIETGCFPDDDHSYHIKKQEFETFQKYINEKKDD